MNTISLQTIWDKWVTAIATNQPILDFCSAKYGKSPKILIGVNLKRVPTDVDCPYIAIDPQSAEEGAGIGEFSYNLPIGIGIKNETVSDEKIGDVQVIRMNGFLEVNELLDLIIKAIFEANPSFPVESWKKEIDSVSMFPQFIGFITPELKIPVVLGGNLTY
jgi:hypothetical protein